MDKGLPRARNSVMSAGSRGNRLRAAACLVSILACPVAAKAPPEPGPTASASVSISVSVARRYGLAADGGARLQGPGQPGRDPFCLASVGGEMHMPVLLIQPSPDMTGEYEPPAARTARRLLPCGSSSRTLVAADALDEPVIARTVIVSPE